MSAKMSKTSRSSLCVAAGVGLCAAKFFSSSFVANGPVARVSPPSAAVATGAAPRVAAETTRPGVVAAASAALTAAAAACTVGRRSRRNNSSSTVACKASPQQLPVIDLEGKQIGEETMDLNTYSAETAAYVVHQVINIWNYQQRSWGAFAKRRGDVQTKKGKKPWNQKGSGRARQGSRYSPHFGKSCTNKGPHGLDNKRNKLNDRSNHYRAISTVLQSKWRNIKIVDGLEEAYPEPKHYDLKERLAKWTATEVGSKSMLMVTRNGFGVEDVHNPQRRDLNSDPLYQSGRLIERLSMRRPRDIDPSGDGLYETLKARRIIISRPAFFDLKAKFERESGWAWKSERDILIEQLQHITKEYPQDRSKEIQIARDLPKNPDERETWARDIRDELLVDASK